MPEAEEGKRTEDGKIVHVRRGTCCASRALGRSRGGWGGACARRSLRASRPSCQARGRPPRGPSTTRCYQMEHSKILLKKIAKTIFCGNATLSWMKLQEKGGTRPLSMFRSSLPYLQGRTRAAALARYRWHPTRRRVWILIDGFHFFLTALACVCTGTPVRPREVGKFY